MKKRISVVTGSRADYDLLFPLLKLIKNDVDFDLRLLVTGSHLSPDFGLTYHQIENDGFLIDKKIEILTNSETSVGIAKSVGLGFMGFSEAYSDLKPDLVILLGDRYEIFSAAASAYILNIPIAHIHGGEITFGSLDDGFRHSITKMASIHFVACEEYLKRVVQLGESPSSVFNVGAMGLDNAKNQTLLSRKDLEKFLNFKFSEKKLLLTFHPENLPEEYIVNHINELLAALDNFNHVSLIFTLPNSDLGSKLISQKIINFVANHSNSRVYSSLGRMGYLSCLANVDGVVGNSSSGILEAPFFNVPTINIGNRQKGRVQPNTVINVSPECAEISAAIEKVLIMGKKPPLLSNSINPYGDGSASQKILAILKRTSLKKINSKHFYDLDFNKGSINGN